MEIQYLWFAIFVLINSTILFLLTANVSRLRYKFRISVGDGGNNELLYAIRAHSNGVEQVTVFGLVVLALGVLNFNHAILALFVIAFSLARVLHAYGMLFKSFLSRRVGAALTYLLHLFGLVALAYQILV